VILSAAAGPAYKPRRRSLASRANDGRILDAALVEIDAAGVDALGMSQVARRAGLTTGALYARYESASELAAAAWTARVRDAHFALLDRVAEAVFAHPERDAPDPDALEDVARELGSPALETRVAIELLTTARRVDELQEVVLPDVHEWLRMHRAHARAIDRHRRARMLYLLTMAWGILLRVAPEGEDLDWRPVLARFQWACAQPAVSPHGRVRPRRDEPVRAATGDPVQDALIESVAAVVARVGLERATVSRIARRAGLTSGAIYGRYSSKEALLEQAVLTLVATWFSDHLVGYKRVDDPDRATAASQIFAGYLGEPHREWRLFRVEAQLAARHHRAIADVMYGVQEQAVQEYVAASRVPPGPERDYLATFGRYAQLVPIGLALTDIVVPGVARVDWRLVLEPLMSFDQAPETE
jgi:AcrR family transcriptional regulator